MKDIEGLLEVTLDLTRSLALEDRYRRLVEVVARIVPCDAVSLLTCRGNAFVPAAFLGLTADVRGRVFARDEHPRLAVIAASAGPVRFPVDSELPDPFDGLLSSDPTALAHVHACLGIPLRVDGKLVGLLTADSRVPSAFDELDPSLLSWLGALAGAALQTSSLIEELESSSHRMGLIAQDLVRSAATHRGPELLGTSDCMQRLREEISLVAPSTMTALITGETGTGKELVARAIHRASSRADKPLIDLNCAAIPSSVAESELFGHCRGAFTGADRDRTGKIELADGATLFLDEIGELPLELQPKILRTLQEGDIQRVGSDRCARVDVRFIAATNRDLEEQVARGRFRDDLFHRLHVYRIVVPPLRERREDIAILAGHFCDQSRVRLGVGPVRLAEDARALIETGAWPGNVRELQNAVQRAVLRAAHRVPQGEVVIVTSTHFRNHSHGSPSDGRSAPPPSPLSLSEQVNDFRRGVIQAALARCDGNWAAASRELGMHRSNLHHLCKRLGLVSDSQKSAGAT